MPGPESHEQLIQEADIRETEVRTVADANIDQVMGRANETLARMNAMITTLDAAHVTAVRAKRDSLEDAIRARRAPVPQGARIDAETQPGGQPSTALRFPDGRLLGTPRSFQPSISTGPGFNAFIAQLATRPIEDVQAYLTSNMADQTKDPPTPPREKAITADQTLQRALMEGKGDSRHVATILALIRARQGRHCAVVAAEPDHVICLEVVRVPGGFKPVFYDSVGCHDDSATCATAEDAIRSTWKNSPAPARVRVLNPDLNQAEMDYAELASRIIN